MPLFNRNRWALIPLFINLEAVHWLTFLSALDRKRTSSSLQSCYFFISLIFIVSIAGSEDNFCRLDSVVRSTEYCDNYVVKIIENAGHWPHQEMPVEFNQVILKFLVGLYIFLLVFMHFLLNS